MFSAQIPSFAGFVVYVGNVHINTKTRWGDANSVHIKDVADEIRAAHNLAIALRDRIQRDAVVDNVTISVDLPEIRPITDGDNSPDHQPMLTLAVNSDNIRISGNFASINCSIIEPHPLHDRFESIMLTINLDGMVDCKNQHHDGRAVLSVYIRDSERNEILNLTRRATLDISNTADLLLANSILTAMFDVDQWDQQS